MDCYYLTWDPAAKAEFKALVSNRKYSDADEILALATKLAEDGRFDPKIWDCYGGGREIYKRTPRQYCFMFALYRPATGPALNGDLKILSIDLVAGSAEANAIRRA